MTPVRYHTAAIALHWVMAVAIVLMLGSGLAMGNLAMEPGFQFELYQWHKSLGVLVLLAAVLRLLVRLTFTPPPLPAGLPKREVWLAHVGHWALYGMMLAMPLTGWLMVSSSPYGLPTLVFGWFEWPHVPGVAMQAELSHFFAEVHELLAFGFLAMLVGHIGAVVYHARAHKQNLVRRLWF